MKNSLFLLTIIMAITLGLTACGSQGNEAPKAVENYITALVNKDAGQLSTLSCASWEPTALTELDSFQAVTIKLEGLSCKQTGMENKNALVLCQGKIIATYGNEDQEIDLSSRTYVLENQGGEWVVCGEQ